MKRLLIPAVAAAIALAAACAPPNTGGELQKPVPPCTATVTVIHENDPLPCIPGPGQRLDVLIAVNGNLDRAVAICNNMGGVPQGPATDPLVCRGVTV